MSILKIFQIILARVSCKSAYIYIVSYYTSKNEAGRSLRHIFI